MSQRELKVIAHIKTDFPTKFGIPRQSGLVDTTAKIIFDDKYRNDDALRGIEGFSHLWLLWDFSENEKADWSPTVRPPRLGGNKRVGVFATRSPFRPNSIGLSSVKLISVEKTKEFGTVLVVSGADLLDNTPIYDIKPYIAFTDSHPDATGGFSDTVYNNNLEVVIPENLKALIPPEKRDALSEILSQDPRPSYQNDPERVYSFEFADMHIEFSVKNNILSVSHICHL